MSGSNDDVLDGGPNDPRWPAITTYLARGWSLLAIVPDTKEPPAYECGDCKDARSRDVHDVVACTCPICHGVYAATTDPERLARALKQVPGALVGVACGATSGITVVDFDTTVDATTGMTGLDTLDQWESWVPGGWSLPSTLRARTKSGGLHLFYETGDDRAITSRVRVLPGVDIKSNGGYVVLPPEPGSLRAWVGSVATAQPTSDELLLWLRTAPGSRPTRGSGYGSGGSNGPLDLSVIGNGGPPQGSQDDFIRDWLFHLYMVDGVTTKQALLQRVWPEVDSWTQDPSRRWKEWMIESKIDKLMRKFDPPEPLPRWERAVAGANGSVVGGTFGSPESSAAPQPDATSDDDGAHDGTVIAVDFGGGSNDSSSGGDGDAGGTPPRPPLGGGDRPDASRDENMTDSGNGLRFARVNQGLVYHDAENDQWYAWDAKIGVIAPVKPKRLRKYVDRTINDIYAQIEEDPLLGDSDLGNAYRQHALATSSTGRTASMLDKAVGVDSLVADVEDFDAAYADVVAQNGTVNLLTGELRRSRPEDMNTRWCRVDYDPAVRDSAELDLYLETFLPDEEDQRFVFALLGNALFRGNAARIMPIIFGETTCGKTQLTSLVQNVLGTYACTGEASIFRANVDDKPRPDLMHVIYRRAAFITEMSKKINLHADQVKRLTGNEVISFRTLHEGKIETQPRFTPILVTNELPTIKEADNAVRRRIYVVHFNRTLASPDPEVGRRFAACQRTRQAVFTRLVEGARDTWLSDPARIPERYVMATMDARAGIGSSTLETFFEWAVELNRLERVDVAGMEARGERVVKSHFATLASVHEWYTAWVRRFGSVDEKREQWGVNEFSAELKKAGYAVEKSGAWRVIGVKLLETAGPFA